MSTVLLGIGSNLGDRGSNIERAISLLKEIPGIRLVSVSSLVETKPEGGPSQGDFLNGALKIETALLPLELLSKLKGIERRLGRVKGEPNGPRPIDLDILFYEDIVIVEGKRLTIPHPKLQRRNFVLRPLLEIAPDFVHPRLQRTVQQLYDENFTHSPNA